LRRGQVYMWVEDPKRPAGRRVERAVVELPRLEMHNGTALTGRYVTVHNGGTVTASADEFGTMQTVDIGDARPNADGDFLFEPGKGGGRLDLTDNPAEDFLWRYIQSSHFGEVNTYFHLDRVAAHVDELLHELGAPSLPRVTAIATAHNSASYIEVGIRDGARRGTRWVAFQGGHYRLPSRRYDFPERGSISVLGEIHLGPGRQVTVEGALADQAAGGRYRANASHNAGIIYHEYGHHIARHTADFNVNDRRKPNRQNNRKPALDEALADYWAATMLDTPHIWAWHHGHEQTIHHRSIASPKTMADFDASAAADAHLNGTIWAAAMWNVRSRLRESEIDGTRKTDMLALQALLLIGGLSCDDGDIAPLRRTRASFSAALSALLEADWRLHAGRHRDIILAGFGRRGILPDKSIKFERT
jgi:hypothetical protein